MPQLRLLDETQRRIEAERALLDLQTTYAAIAPYGAKGGARVYNSLSNALSKQLNGSNTTKPSGEQTKANRSALMRDLKQMGSK